MDAWKGHVSRRRVELESPFSPWGFDMTRFEDFGGKTLIYYNAVDDKYTAIDLQGMVWSLEFGCNVGDEYAYAEELSLGFLCIPSHENYAYRRNTALCVKERAFQPNPDVLKDAFLNSPFETVIPHPFAHQTGSPLPVVPLARLMYMMVIDKPINAVSDVERKHAVKQISERFAQIDRLEFFQAARLASWWASCRSDPGMLVSTEGDRGKFTFFAEVETKRRNETLD